MADDIDELLSSSLRAPTLRPEALVAMRAAVQQEWRSELTRRSRARVWVWACAASLAAVAVFGGWQLTRAGAAFGTVQGQSAGLTVHRASWWAEHAVTDGTVRVGDRLEASADTLIQLPGVASLRLRSGASVRITAANEAQLRAGTAYVDTGPPGSGGELNLRTPLGLVEHLGTQFEADWQDAHLRVRVREGAVRVAGRVRADAGEEVMLDAAGDQQRRDLPAYDSEWNWVETLSNAPDVDGRSVMVLLRWVARETGRQLEFADGGAAQLANTARLHGSISGLTPDLALRAMLATTSLQADVQTGRIVVRLANPPRT